MFFAFALVMLGVMTATGAKKVLLSADFETSSPFGGWGNNHTREVVDGTLKITNPSAVNSWEAQMAYDFSEAFLPNSEYTLTMRIRGSAAGQISIGIQNPDGYASCGEFGVVDFDVDWQYVKLTTLCNGEGGSRFIFSFGQFEGDIYIDDLELSLYIEGEEKIERYADPNLRWTNVLTNSDLEGEEVISFVKTENNPDVVDSLQKVVAATITDGIGRDGSRGIKVQSFPGAVNSWDAQFWMVLPQTLNQGDQYRVKFDLMATQDITAETQAHRNPGNYIHYAMIGNPQFTTEWTTFEAQGSLTKDQAGDGTFQSIAFNLAIDKETQVDFFFDNLTFDIFHHNPVPQYADQVILVDFGYPTNAASLVAPTGKKRLIYDNQCVTVTVDGEEIAIASVEAFADGAFYIFTEDLLDEDVEIVVSFTNPINPAYRLVYTDGPGGDVEDFQLKAFYNENVSKPEDAITNEFAAPEVVSITPANNSINLPVTLNEIKVVFDKPVSCDDILAWLGSEKLAVTPATGYAEEITLTRTGAGDLAEGSYEIDIKKIHSENNADDSNFWGEAIYSISIGHDLSQVDEVNALIAMFETANQKRYSSSDSIYAGDAYNTLCTMIDEYQAIYLTFTHPDAFRNATKTLNAAIVDLDAHCNLVNDYYNTVNNAVSAVATYSTGKFAGQPLLVELEAALANYIDAEGVAIYLTADADLQAAIDAMSAAANSASKLFTEGASQVGTTGVAALVERIRLGANALLSLGVSPSDELITAANNVMFDDDVLATQIKNRLKLELYSQLKTPGNTLFQETVDEETLESVTPTYDMTVFVKNPNVYKTTTSGNFTAENVPGWITPEGERAPGLSTGWSDPGYYCDGMFQTWKSGYVVEQTIADLPAGVYTLKIGFGERDSEADAPTSFIYAKNSATADGEYVDSTAAPHIGQTFPYANVQIDDLVVTDGVLTIGAVGGPSSCTFFNDVRLYIKGSADGLFDYAAGYNQVLEDIAGIQGTEVAPATILGIELYDLNGRRISKAQQGIVIMKKYMSNGTIVVEKVVKK